jgi:hypothetical protein
MTLPGGALPRYASEIMWPLEIWTPDESQVATHVYPAEFERLCKEDAIWGRGSKTRLRQVFWRERAFNDKGVWRTVRRMPPGDKYVYRQSLADTFKVWAFRHDRARQAEAEDRRHAGVAR